MRILLIEDHLRLAEAIAEGLDREGFGVDMFATGEDGEAAARTLSYDAIILDLGLPDRDGLSVLKALRATGNSTPALILTARDGIDARVSGLDSGADDYLLKPFAMKELAARLRALLRRPGAILGAVLKAGNVELDSVNRVVTVNGLAASIPRREFDVLELLMRRAGQVVTRAALEEKTYGLNYLVLPNALEAAISRLRKHLSGASAGVSILAMRGVGYLLTEGKS
jgi:DNA-binding response OmpR family regulator